MSLLLNVGVYRIDELEVFLIDFRILLVETNGGKGKEGWDKVHENALIRSIRTTMVFVFFPLLIHIFTLEIRVAPFYYNDETLVTS